MADTIIPIDPVDSLPLTATEIMIRPIGGDLNTGTTDCYFEIPNAVFTPPPPPADPIIISGSGTFAIKGNFTILTSDLNTIVAAGSIGRAKVNKVLRELNIIPPRDE